MFHIKNTVLTVEACVRTKMFDKNINNISERPHFTGDTTIPLHGTAFVFCLLRGLINYVIKIIVGN